MSAERGRGARLARHLRDRLGAGLVVLLPLWCTWIVLGFVFAAARDASVWVLEGLIAIAPQRTVLSPLGVTRGAVLEHGVAALSPLAEWGISAVAVLLTVLALYATGTAVAHVSGRQLLGAVVAVIGQVPGVSTIYRAVRQILVSFTSDTSRSFQRVVLVPFPNDKARSIGFVTQSSREPDVVTVFVPTTPNPTTGFLLVLREADVVDLGWSVEEAVRVVMSGGTLLEDASALAVRPPATP